MLIVAERVNASRKAIRAALEKLDAAAIQLANNAARGDKNSIQFAVALMQALEPPVQAEQDTRTVIILPSNGRE